MLAKSRTNGFGHRSHPEDCTSGSRSGSHSPTAAPSTSRPHREGGYLNAFDDTESMNSIGTDQSAPLRDGYRLPARNFQANTGPKGVIADARNFEQARRRDLRAKSRKASMATQGHTSATNGFIPSMPSLPPDFASRLAAIDGSSHANGGSHEDTKVSLDNWDRSAMSSSSPDDDEDFMSVWRRQRLLEMQSGDGIYSKRQDARDALTKKRYGRVELVDAGGYLDAVEKTKDDVVVVVLIYDDEVSSAVPLPSQFTSGYTSH